MPKRLQREKIKHESSGEIYNTKCHKSDLRDPLHGIFGNSVFFFSVHRVPEHTSQLIPITGSNGEHNDSRKRRKCFYSSPQIDQ